MRRGHHKTSLNNHQRHHLVKMMSIISLICLLLHTILSPINQYVDAKGNGLGISLSTSSVNETEVLVATLIDTGEESNGSLSFTVPEGLEISGIVAGQENIEAISNGNQTLQFNWTENSNKIVQVQLQAQKAGDYTATFSSSDSTVSASVTVVAPVTDEVESNQTETETVATEDKEGTAQTPSIYADSLEAKKHHGNYDDEAGWPDDDDYFDHIDIEAVGSFKYKVNGDVKTVTINFDSLNDLGTLAIYEGTSADIIAGTATKITDVPEKQESQTEGYDYEWRYEGTFDERKTYTVVYDFTVDVDGETHYFHFEQEYTYDGDTNICSGSGKMRGLDVAINASDLENIVTQGSLTLSKEAVDTAGNPLTGDFTFIIASEENNYSKTIQATTTNGKYSTTINGLKAGAYTITERDPSGAISQYMLHAVTAKVGGTDSSTTKIDGNYVVNATIDQGQNQIVAFKNIYEQNNKSISIEKTITNKQAVDGEYVFAPGETVQYKIVVKNDGNAALNNITLSDEFLRAGELYADQLTIIGYEGAFSLAVDEEKIFTATFIVPEKEVGETVYKNTATAKVGELERSSSVDFIVESRPALEVTKKVDLNKVKPGNKVTYTITVSNTGNTVLEDVVLTDLMKKDDVVMDQQLVLMLDGKEYKGPSFTLDIDETKTFTAVYEVPDKTKVGTIFYNVATATSGSLEETANATVTVENDPDLEVKKSVDKTAVKPGEKVTYTYIVKNTGNSDLQVTLSDVFSENGIELDKQLQLKYESGQVYNGEEFTLAYDGEAKFTAEFIIPDLTKVGTEFYNVITAKAGELEVTDHAKVTVLDYSNLAVDKTVDKKVAKPGDTVIYTYTVSNIGNSDLKVTLADVFKKNGEKLDKQLDIYYENGDAYNGEEFDLAYKGKVIFKSEYIIPTDTKEGTTFNNVVTVTSGELKATDNETVTIDKVPAFSVDKSVNQKVAKPGDTVIYTYTVTNLGNSDLEVTLSDVLSENGKKLDTQLTLLDENNVEYDGKAFLLPYKGEVKFTAVFKIPDDAKVDTKFKNVVTATSGDIVKTDAETVTVANKPGLEVDKSVDEATAKPGETVTYTYIVKNTGNSDLEVTLEDVFTKNGKKMDKQLELLDENGDVYGGEAFTLPYKGEVKFTAVFTIPDNTKVGTVYDNKVTVESGELEAKDEEKVTVEENPNFEVDKLVDEATAKPGETVTYTYIVKNTGNSDLTVKLSDVMSENDKALATPLELKYERGEVYDGGAFTVPYKGEVKFTAVFTIPDGTKVDTKFHNVVTVTNGNITKTDDETVTVENKPGLEVDKSVDKETAKPGDTVIYTYIVKNTGNSDLQVTLTDVLNENGVALDKQLELKDESGKVYKGEAFTLPYKGEVKFTAVFTIPDNTKVDTVYENKVTVASGELESSDKEEVTVEEAPNLEVDKSVDNETAKPGESVIYTYIVKNTGNSDLEVTLSDVLSENGTVLDKQLELKDESGKVYTGEAFTLAYKGEAKFTAVFTIPDNTKVDTKFHNVVTVTAGDITKTDDETVTVENKPGLEVDKSVDEEKVKPGETVTYTYIVKNTGNSDLQVTLTDVLSENGVVLDKQLELIDESGKVYTGEVFTLPYKGEVKFTAVFTIPDNTKVDTVYSNKVKVISGDLESSDEEEVTVEEAPSFEVDKSVNKNEALPGETVLYTYIVKNTGNSDLQVTLSDVFSKNGVVLDEQLKLQDENGKAYNGEAFTLAYNGEAKFTAEYMIPSDTKVDTIFHNEVTAISGKLKETDAEDVKVLNKPGLEVDKYVDKEEAKPGETVRYTYIVENTGNSDLQVTLSDVFTENGVVLDKQLELTDENGQVYTGEAFTLPYKGIAKFTAVYTIPDNTKVDTVYHNEVTVVSGELEAKDEETVIVAEAPGLAVDKSVDKNLAKPGETVTYTYIVKNMGNSDLEVTLSDVFSENGVVLDKQLELRDESGKVYNGEVFTLAYKGEAKFTAVFTIPDDTKVDTKFYNVVTATSGELEAKDDETVTVDNNPGLMVDKSVDNNVAKPGETVTYTYIVKNIGNSDLEVTLSDVFSENGVVLDKQLELRDEAGNIYNGEAFTLAYKGEVKFTAEYKIPGNTKANTQFHNVVTVKSGELEATDDETVTVDSDPNMTVVKTASQTSAKPGEKVTYTITVSNTGNTNLNVTLSDVFSENGKVMEEQLVLKDEEGNVYKGEAFTLAYGETATFTAEYTIPEDAKADTLYHNVVTATDEEVTVTDDEDVTVDAVPSLKAEKTAEKEQYLPGETVVYTINVTNDGNIDLEGITLDDIFSKNEVVEDQQLTVEGYEGAFNLAIGETMSFTSHFVIPEDTLADTTFKNVVTIKTGDISSDILDEAVIVVDPTYAFTIEKTADKTEATVGETVTYSIVVTNTGNKALTNVLVKDDMIGLDTVIDQLAVNESKTLTGEYVVTADDIGELENIATATVEIDGEPITHDASVIVRVTAKADAAVDADQVVNSTQNPQTGDTTINTLLVLIVFVLAGSGLYTYKRKLRG